MNNITHICFLILFFALILFGEVFGVSAAFAAPPRPQSKAIVLETFEEKLKEQERTQEIMQLEIHELEEELEVTRKSLVSKAKAVQSSEAALKNLEDQIEELQKDKERIEDTIDKDRRSIGKLVMALERLRRLPPEVIIARPDAPINTARSSMLMGDIVPVLTRRAEKLRNEMAVLQETRVKLEQKRVVAAERSVRLGKQYSKMSSLLKAREQIYKRTHGDYKQQEKKVGRIARQSRNLKDLVRKLDEDKKRARARDLAARGVAKTKRDTAKSVQKKRLDKGGSQLPVSGTLLVQYGDPDSFGAKSKGVKIEGRSGALVVAPMKGVVRFAGAFKNYGNMVIVDHKNGYHSLVAGLKKIDTVVGQDIAAGEPIGTLPNAIRRHKPVLYYELRFKGNAVNPAKKFSELS